MKIETPRVVSNTIKFIANRGWLNKDSISAPSPTSKNIPDWYSRADRYAINPKTNDYFKAKVNGIEGKIPTWKACPALMDAFSFGYVFKTPCDISFFMNSKNEIDVEVHDSRYNRFCTRRMPLPQFKEPYGYHPIHFAWEADWGIETPEGFSSLYLNPMNRLDLPFLNTEGIIDTDKIGNPGTLPFFLIKNWVGTIPAGTPYLQVFPFRREDWNSEIIEQRPSEIKERHNKMRKIFRVPDGGIYKNKYWSRKKFD